MSRRMWLEVKEQVGRHKFMEFRHVNSRDPRTNHSIVVSIVAALCPHSNLYSATYTAVSARITSFLLANTKLADVDPMKYFPSSVPDAFHT